MGTPTAAGRIAWIDTLRGLGILLVVAGHVFTDPAAHHAIFLFHMPLFFFLSGMMFRGGRAPDIATRRFRTLLVPYVAFLALAVLLDVIAVAIDGSPSLPYLPIWKFAAKLAFGGSALRGGLGVAWFIPCLYLTSVLFAAVSARLGGTMKPAVIAVVAAAGALAYLWPPMKTPLGIGQVPFAFVCFWAGAAFQGVRWPSWAGALALLAFISSIPWVPSIDMKYMAFGWPVISLAVALCGTLGLITVAQAAARVPGFWQGLCSLGRASLVIMFLHMVFMIHLRPYLPEALLFAVAVALPYLGYLLMLRYDWARVAFLGQPSRAVSGAEGPAPIVVAAAVKR